MSIVNRIAEELNKLLSTKTNIKNAIKTISDIADDTKFENYAEKINAIEDIKIVIPDDLYFLITYDETTFSYLFNSYQNSTNYGTVRGTLFLNNLDTSNVTNMDLTFERYSCDEFICTNWDTTNVTSMYATFLGCDVKNLDLSSWKTSQVTIMGAMFADCLYLETLDISNFDVSNVSYTDRMFSNCKSLYTLRLDNCSGYTVNKLITSDNFPTNAIEGKTRTIYCKKSAAVGLTPPENWVFSFV